MKKGQQQKYISKNLKEILIEICTQKRVIKFLISNSKVEWCGQEQLDRLTIIKDAIEEKETPK